ncbi:MAG: hypothetical protein JXR60_11420 [Bacteroidales bacterium]|nr:hypothetical protein [Bacteroidales bacterium]
MRTQRDREHFSHEFYRKRSRHTSLSRLFAAIMFMGAGLLLIAHQTDYISDYLFHILFSWQILLIGIGLVSVTKRGGSMGGAIMILVGGVFLLPELIDISLNMKKMMFPAILIGVGLIILFKGFDRWQGKMRRRFSKGDYSDIDTIDANHIFGGGDYYITSNNFKGGKINCVFGGGKYNFRKAKLADGVQVLDVSMIFGGLEIHVPKDWEVKVEVDSIIGGFNYKHNEFDHTEANPSGHLIIKGTAIFGGGELKRY